MNFLKFILLGLLSSYLLLSQNQNEKKYERVSSTRIGLPVGLNSNFLALGYQNLSPNGGDFREFKLIDGTSISPFLGLQLEYLSSNWWGIGLRASYDNRSGIVEDISISPHNEFDISLSYLNINPYFRIDQNLLRDLSFNVGPILAFKLNSKIDFNSSIDERTDIAHELSDFTLGIRAGFAYDINISNTSSSSRFILSPFIDYSLLVNQKSSNFDNIQNSFDDVWSTSTIRLGLTASIDFLNLEKGSEGGEDLFSLILPYDGKVRYREVEEFFPLVPHVFFDDNSQSIPSRYTILNLDEASKFDVNDISNLESLENIKNQSSANKKLAYYYNILNIYGSKLKDDEDLNLTLVGSAPKRNDGDLLASTIKDYLVNNFGVEETRITIKKQQMPNIPSGTSSTPVNYRPYTDLENRRVEFIFDKEEPYKLHKLTYNDLSSIDNDLIFVLNNDVEYDAWSVTISKDDKTYNYGPFYSQIVRINPFELLSDFNDGGKFDAVVVTNIGGKQITDKMDFSISVSKEKNKSGKKYTILFDYGKNDAIKVAEKQLRGQVANEVNSNDLLVISGYTDEIGSDAVNKTLSEKRANETKDIFKDQFLKDNKKVTIDTYGFGKTTSINTFNNKLPEGRFYNRNVSLYIIPQN